MCVPFSTSQRKQSLVLSWKIRCRACERRGRSRSHFSVSCSNIDGNLTVYHRESYVRRRGKTHFQRVVETSLVQKFSEDNTLHHASSPVTAGDPVIFQLTRLLPIVTMHFQIHLSTQRTYRVRLQGCRLFLCESAIARCR